MDTEKKIKCKRLIKVYTKRDTKSKIAEKAKKKKNIIRNY